MAWHPTGRAQVNARKPQALAVCDRCGLTYNLVSLTWQYQWQGMQLQNLRILVCDTCLDKPQVQLRTIILPPDPLPVFNPRPEAYDTEVPSNMIEMDESSIFVTMGGVPLVMMSKGTPSPNPDDPYLIPEDF